MKDLLIILIISLCAVPSLIALCLFIAWVWINREELFKPFRRRQKK